LIGHPIFHLSSSPPDSSISEDGPMENKMPFLGIINCRNLWKIDYHLQLCVFNLENFVKGVEPVATYIK
ncbi:MAG: hypothetical protein J6E40_08180, partial [Lachnospiraceae bacterium]|nr:hypothetical protein [Lachnospiraceae bacterium]